MSRRTQKSRSDNEKLYNIFIWLNSQSELIQYNTIWASRQVAAKLYVAISANIVIYQDNAVYR
jgi:hypothetical protein